MDFFRNWPLNHYLTLRGLQQAGFPTFYYHVSKDILISAQEAENYKEKPNRKNDRYLLVGPAKIINDVFGSITAGTLPMIPEEVEVVIKEHQNADDFVKKLLEKDKKINLPPVTVQITEKVGPTTPKLRVEDAKPAFDTDITVILGKIKEAIEKKKCVKLDTGSLVNRNPATYLLNNNEEIPLCMPKDTKNYMQVFSYYEKKLTELMGGKSVEGKEKKTSEKQKIALVQELQKDIVVSPSLKKQNRSSDIVHIGVPPSFQRRVIQVPIEGELPDVSNLKSKLPTGRPQPIDTVDALQILKNEKRVVMRKVEKKEEERVVESKFQPRTVNRNQRQEDVDIEMERKNPEISKIVSGLKKRTVTEVIEPETSSFGDVVTTEVELGDDEGEQDDGDQDYE